MSKKNSSRSAGTTKDRRARQWTTSFLLSDPRSQALTTALASLGARVDWAWIDHDRDPGKKPHRHTVLKFSDAKRASDVARWLGIPATSLRQIKGRKGWAHCLRYLTHADPELPNPGECIYSPDDVHANFDWEAVVSGANLPKRRPRIDQLAEAVLTGEMTVPEIRKKYADVFSKGGNSARLRRMEHENFLQRHLEWREEEETVRCRADEEARKAQEKWDAAWPAVYEPIWAQKQEELELMAMRSEADREARDERQKETDLMAKRSEAERESRDEMHRMGHQTLEDAWSNLRTSNPQTQVNWVLEEARKAQDEWDAVWPEVYERIWAQKQEELELMIEDRSLRDSHLAEKKRAETEKKRSETEKKRSEAEREAQDEMYRMGHRKFESAWRIVLDEWRNREPKEQEMQ